MRVDRVLRSWIRTSLAVTLATYCMAASTALGGVFDIVPRPAIRLEHADEDDGSLCASTARALFNACRHSVNQDFFAARAVCINISAMDERKRCFDEAATSRIGGRKSCQEQLNNRRNACVVPGLERYDPANLDADVKRPSIPHRCRSP